MTPGELAAQDQAEKQQRINLASWAYSMFAEFQEAGFTHDEAMDLTMHVLDYGYGHVD